jgi:hypothetical protein
MKSPIFFLAVQYNLKNLQHLSRFNDIVHCPWHLLDFDVIGCGQGPCLRRPGAAGDEVTRLHAVLPG